MFRHVKEADENMVLTYDIDSYVLCGKDLSIFNPGSVFRVNLEGSPPLHCQNMKLTRELKLIFRYRNHKFYDFIIGGNDIYRINMLLVFRVPEDGGDINVDHYGKKITDEVLIPALTVLNRECKTRRHNAMPEVTLHPDGFKVFAEDWDRFSRNVMAKIFGLHRDTFFYRFRHGLSCDEGIVFKELELLCDNLELMAVVQLHIAVEVKIKDSILCFDLENVKKSANFSSVMTYPRFLTENLGNFSAFIKMSRHYYLTYLQGYDTKFHMLPKKRSPWPFFISAIVDNFANMKNFDHVLKNFARETLLNKSKIDQYLTSSAKENGARLEGVFTFLHYQNNKLDDLKKIHVGAKDILRNFLFENKLLLKTEDGMKLHRVILDKLKIVATYHGNIVKEAELSYVYNFEVVLRKFLDYGDPFNDNAWYDQLSKTKKIDFRLRALFDVENMKEMTKKPYDQFYNHLGILVASLDTEGIGETFFRTMGKAVVNHYKLVTIIPREIRNRPEKIFLLENFKRWKKATERITSVVTPLELAKQLSKADKRLTSLAISVVSKANEDVGAKLHEYVEKNVQVFPSQFLYKNGKGHGEWMRVASVADYLKEPSYPFPPNLSGVMRQQANLTQFTKQFEKLKKRMLTEPSGKYSKEFPVQIIYDNSSINRWNAIGKRNQMQEENLIDHKQPRRGMCTERTGASF